MRKFTLHLFILFAFYSINMSGQFRPVENHPSPNAASLGVYGDIPVSLHTGTPNVSIPLYEVKEGDISLPIVLSYHLADVKPNKRSGWLGLGWNLSAGGCITRNVRGCYDEKQDDKGKSMGFYDNHPKLQSVTDAASLSSHSRNFVGLNQPTYELMTDEYIFNFGNYSGSFYLNEYGEWVVVSDDDIKVEFNPASGFRSLKNLRSEIDPSRWTRRNENNRFFDIFTLITPDGMRYTFGGQNATEYSIPYYSRNNSDLVATSWFLTKIESPRNYTLSLEYEAGLPVCEIQFAAFSSYTWIKPESASWNDIYAPPGNTEVVDNTRGRKRLSGYLIFPVYLKKIQASYVYVDIHSATEALGEQEARPHGDFMAWDDETATGNLFNGNKIVPGNQFQVFMPSSDLTKIRNEYMRWRILRAISINPLIPDFENDSMKDNVDYAKSYYFEYTFEGRRKLSRIGERKGPYEEIIEWMYAGGMKYPLRYLTPEATDYTPRDYSFTYNTSKIFPRYIFASVDHWGFYNGGERSFSETILFDDNYYQTRQPAGTLDIAQAETLQEINYPTGGKTSFGYKRHRYGKIVPKSLSDDLIVQNGTAGGLCVSEVKAYDTDGSILHTKKYYYTDDISTINNSNYKTSGILKAKKEYGMNYTTDQSSIYAIYSEGGFMASGTNRTDAHITYSAVIEQSIDANGRSNGFVRYKYTNYDTDIWGEKHMDEEYLYSNSSKKIASYYNQTSSKSMERGKKVSEEYFDKDNKLVKSINYKYGKVATGTIKTPYQESYVIFSDPMNVIFIVPVSMTNTYTNRYFLTNEIETYYNPATGKELQKREKTFDYTKNKLIGTEKLVSSNKELFKTVHTYPADFVSNEPYKSMVDNHILTPVVEKTQYQNGTFLNKEIADYAYIDRKYLPKYLKTQKSLSSDPKTKITYNDYDWHGNPLYITIDETFGIGYFWSYEGQYLNAEIKNYNGEMFLYPNDEFKDNEDIEFLLEDIPDAQISIRSHIPAVGVSSTTTSNGVTTYYDYDALGRLKETYIMEDGEKKTIQTQEYNYY